MSTSRNETKSMALFCDFENVALGVKDAKYTKFDIRKVLERLLLKGSIVVKKAYCDWERYREYKAAMHQASFEMIEIPHVRQSGKNSADIRMVVDALDLCYTKSHVDTFVIISGDSDFSPLVSKLRENAKTVIGVGVKNSTSDLLIANCDEFIYYDDLVRGQPPARPARSRSGSAGRGPRTETPAAEAVESRGPATLQGEGQAARGTAQAASRGAPRATSQAVSQGTPLEASQGTPPAVVQETPQPESQGTEQPASPTGAGRSRRRSGSAKGAAGPVAAAQAAAASEATASVEPAISPTTGTSGRAAPDALAATASRTKEAHPLPSSGEVGDAAGRVASPVDAGSGSPSSSGDAAAMPEAQPADGPVRKTRTGTRRRKAAAEDGGPAAAIAVVPADEISAPVEAPKASPGPAAAPTEPVVVEAVPEAPRKRTRKTTARKTGAARAESTESDANATEGARESSETLAPDAIAHSVVAVESEPSPPAAPSPEPEVFPPADDFLEDRIQEALDLVLRTIEALAAERGYDDKIWGSMVKQTLKRQRPGFNENYYGFRSFNGLLEEARDRGLVELERDEKSGGYTVRSLA